MVGIRSRCERIKRRLERAVKARFPHATFTPMRLGPVAQLGRMSRRLQARAKRNRADDQKREQNEKARHQKDVDANKQH